MCSTTLSETTPVARKEHKCDWCGEEILIGEKYHRWTGIFESDFGDTKMHLVCNEAYHKSDFCSDEGFRFYEQKKGQVEGYGE